MINEKLRLQKWIRGSGWSTCYGRLAPMFKAFTVAPLNLCWVVLSSKWRWLYTPWLRVNIFLVSMLSFIAAFRVALVKTCFRCTALSLSDFLIQHVSWHNCLPSYSSNWLFCKLMKNFNDTIPAYSYYFTQLCIEQTYLSCNTADLERRLVCIRG
jgi:hypothetical protein